LNKEEKSGREIFDNLIYYDVYVHCTVRASTRDSEHVTLRW